MNAQAEFDRQLQVLLDKKYPEMLGISEGELIKNVELLREKLSALELKEIDLEAGYLPFMIVIQLNGEQAETAMSRVNREGKEGITKLFPHTSSDFQTIESVTIPSSTAYLLIDIDRGQGNRNLPPNEAMKLIVEKGRSPLTIAEGIAIITQYPEFLQKNNCFSMLASRHPGDQRVPAIWINAQKNPNLGWCWDGNPHTWLGSASAKIRS